jgi:hypothetical protein
MAFSLSKNLRWQLPKKEHRKTPSSSSALPTMQQNDRSPAPLMSPPPPLRCYFNIAYETLTPDVVLDVLASVGSLGDGRLTALSSHENRVYQVRLKGPGQRGRRRGGRQVLPFQRRINAQIEEERRLRSS